MVNCGEWYRFRLGLFLQRWLTGCVVILLWGSQSGTAMAAGAAPAEKLVNIADTRFLEPGLTKWAADIYNSSLLAYGLMGVLVMAVMGIVLGLVCDRLVGLLGLNLGKMQHHE